jgi:hypothetical protein
MGLLGALLLAFLFAAYGCGRESGGDGGSASPWLAVVGGDTLRADRFRHRYESTPHVGRGGEASAAYLRALVVEALLARHARARQLDTLAGVRSLVRQLAREEAVEAWLAARVRERSDISPQLLAEHRRRLREVRTLEAWSLPDSTSALRALAAIRQRGHFAGPLPRLPEARFVEAHPLTYNEATPAFERLTWALRPGDLGGPIQADGRWWLLHLLAVRPHSPTLAPDRSEEEYLRSVIRRRLAGPLQEALIAEEMEGRSLTMDRDAFHALARHLASILPEGEGEERAPLVALRDRELAPETAAGLDLEAPLVRLEGFRDSLWRVGDVLERLAVGPRPLRGSSLPRSLRDEILFLAEFEVLAQRAEVAGTARSAEVRADSAMWARHVLAQKGLAHLAAVLHEAVRVDQPEELAPGQQARSDSLMLRWLDRQARREGVRFNPGALAALELTESPVLLRKTHFPNRPLAPMPVGYRWAAEWSPPSQP